MDCQVSYVESGQLRGLSGQSCRVRSVVWFKSGVWIQVSHVESSQLCGLCHVCEVRSVM